MGNTCAQPQNLCSELVQNQHQENQEEQNISFQYQNNNDVTQNNDSVYKVTYTELNTKILCEVVDQYQSRKFCEEIILVNNQGGDEFFFQGLLSHPNKGISSQQNELNQRESKFGHNRKAVKESKSFFELLCDSLGDLTLRILMAAALVSFAIEMATSDHRETAWIESFAILVAVGVCSTVTAVNDYQKEKQFQALNNVADSRKMVNIIRDSQISVVHQSELLVGDVMVIETGMEIPADGWLFEGSEITTDESAMTGETNPMKKDNLTNCLSKKNQIESSLNLQENNSHKVQSPLLLSGTKCLSGEGKMVVIAVGQYSALGKIKSMLDQEDSMTPLQEKLTKIAEDIGIFGMYSACLIVSVLIIRFSVVAIQENKFEDSDYARILKFFIIGITVIVVAIPEGLPLAVTLSLAYSVKKMLKDQNLVRKLQACETMGGANTICSDKTGTLTQNKMTLESFWNGSLVKIDTYNKKINIFDFIQQPIYEQFMQSTSTNSSAFLDPIESGSKTEIAILLFLKRAGIDFEGYKQKINILQKMPFSSSRKRMSTLIQQQQSKRLVTKGASEIVLSCCDKMQLQDGSIINLNSDQRSNVEKAIEVLAHRIYRSSFLQKFVLIIKDIFKYLFTFSSYESQFIKVAVT